MKSLAASLSVLALLLTACDGGHLYLQPEPGRGDVARGRELLVRHACYDCHIIPGVDRKPGPGTPVALAGLARKERIASGRIANTRENVESYVQFPRKVLPGALMPGIGHRPDEARDIAAYLVTLD